VGEGGSGHGYRSNNWKKTLVLYLGCPEGVLMGRDELGWAGKVGMSLDEQGWSG
jgi:hypothetical protein